MKQLGTALLVLAGLAYVGYGWLIDASASSVTHQLYANGVQIKGLILIIIAVLINMLPNSVTQSNNSKLDNRKDTVIDPNGEYAKWLKENNTQE
jgi:hypothetical protein